MDVNDDRMHLSFAIKSCGYNTDKEVLDVDMCLMEMEEDEVEDYGGCFPLSLESGDESLQRSIGIGTEMELEEPMPMISGRAVIVHIQNKAANSTKQVETVQTMLFQRSKQSQGSVKFSINERAVLSTAAKAKAKAKSEARISYSKLVKYVFCHEPTGAEMEIRSPLMPILHWHWTKTKEQQPHLSFFAGNPPLLASTGSKESAETNRERVAAPRPRPSNSNSNRDRKSVV